MYIMYAFENLQNNKKLELWRKLKFSISIQNTLK